MSDRLEEIRQRWVATWTFRKGEIVSRPFVWKDGDVAWLVEEVERLRGALEQIAGPCSPTEGGRLNKAFRRTGVCDCDPCIARAALGGEGSCDDER